jgi:hypothetical protein
VTIARALLVAAALGAAAAAARRSGPVRLPGPAAGVGLGDLVARGTSAVGVAPCAPCAARRRALNGWARFGGGPT